MYEQGTKLFGQHICSGLFFKIILLVTLDIMSDDKLEFGHPCSMTHRFLVLLTDCNMVFSSNGLIVLKSIISEEIFFIFSSFEDAWRAFITDGPKPIIVISFPFFLIK